jgi:hypothetical protein
LLSVRGQPFWPGLVWRRRASAVGVVEAVGVVIVVVATGAVVGVGAPRAVVVLVDVVCAGAVVGLESLPRTRPGVGTGVEEFVVGPLAARVRESVDGARACASTATPAPVVTCAEDVPAGPAVVRAWWRVRRTGFVRERTRPSRAAPRCPVAGDHSGPITAPTAPPAAQTTSAISPVRQRLRRRYVPGADSPRWATRAGIPDVCLSTTEDRGLPPRVSARRSDN